MASAADFSPRPDQRANSLIATVADRLTAMCALVPYALVALGLRMVMARGFFLAGQSKLDGPAIPVTLFGTNHQITVILPAGVKEATLRAFETDYAHLPISPIVAAYVVTYAEFVLPVCLVLGFATRLSALALLVMTVLIQLYVAPAMLWTAHVYWIGILLVLMSVGPGAISADRLIRHVYQK
jgi:putative oxidoreductase